MTEDMLQVGVITSTHGIRGEVKVFPTTDDNNRFKKLKDCFIEYKNEMIPVKANGCKFFKNMVILHFDGINDINDVEKYKQCKLFVDRQHAVPLQKDEYYMTDLIDITVVTETDRTLGVLKEIIPTGANDVYVVVDEEGKEILLPAIKECILSVDLEKGIMQVKLMKGLVDEA